MFKRPLALASLVAASLLLAAPPADAQKRSPNQGQGIDRITPPQMTGLLRNLGHQAEVVTENNRTRVRTQIGNRRVSVYFYACNNAGCQSIQYRALFQRSDRFSLAFVNAWNYEKRFAKAYLDADGDLVLEWDVDFDGGVTVGFMTESVNTFQTMLRTFDTFTPRGQGAGAGTGGAGRSMTPGGDGGAGRSMTPGGGGGTGRSVTPGGEAGRGFGGGGMDTGRSLAPGGGGRVTTPDFGGGADTGRSVTPGGGGGRSMTPGTPPAGRGGGGDSGKTDTGDRPGERRT
ncbi:YbjN domain-containing protein [Phreatobacter sp.]|uniref:YbjN domain-containing protein n=1 Tax=Phreatobacter sp. TaxID=1966341 RepID=UPI003F724F70